MDEPERPAAISWFEIPVEDVDRAVAFYSAVLGCEFTVDDETGDTYPMFTAPDGDVFGALNLAGEYPVGGDETPVRYEPSEAGLLVYLTVRDVDEALEAVESAGGAVRVGKQVAPDGATYAIINDPAGNRVGLMADG